MREVIYSIMVLFAFLIALTAYFNHKTELCVFSILIMFIAFIGFINAKNQGQWGG